MLKWNITTPNIKNEDMETEGTKLRTKEYLFTRSQKRIIHFSTFIFFWNFLFHSYFLVIPTLFLGTFLSVFPLPPSFFLFFYLSTLLSSLFFVSCISFLYSLYPYSLLPILTFFPNSSLAMEIPCNSGSYSLAGSASCSPCPIGTYIRTCNES